MMEFTYPTRRTTETASQRPVVMGTHGMAASSQHLATLAGYKILAKGGNAVDAAVAMLSMLNVVEPFSVGLGGDAFALLYLARENRLVGMNGSGRAPYGATIDWYRNHGMKEIPERGILSSTVPGALHGWVSALERYGTFTLADVFGDAIHYAENGFPVTEVIAGEWKYSEPVLLSTKGGSKTYLLAERPRGPGNGLSIEIWPGPIKRSFARGRRHSTRERSVMRSLTFRIGTRGFFLTGISETTPLPGWNLSQRSIGVTLFMNCLPMVRASPPWKCSISSKGMRSAEWNRMDRRYLHLLIEAKKTAFNDRDRYITDPEWADIPVAQLLSKDYAGRIRERIRRDLASPPSALSPYPSGSETVYVTAVDKDRNAASFISSIFLHFGSGAVVDGTGIVLQNRGKSFSLDPNHFNRLEPHKRPMHTIIPGMVFKDGRFLMSFGVMGGDMQPQGHVQFLINLIDFKMNLQEAVDAPRIRHLQGMEVYLEDGISERTREALQKKGHRPVNEEAPINQVGGGQAIYFDRDQNVLLGASDRRKDGCAIGY